MKRLMTCATVLVAAVVSGCASVTGSPNQSVSVQTRSQGGQEVPGAACELSNDKGKWFVTTPGSVTVHRSNEDMQVLCSKAGLEPGRAAVVSETKGAMFGNIILGGGIGAIIDHNSGAAYEYPGFLQIIMGALSRIEMPKEGQDASQAPAPAQMAPAPAGTAPPATPAASVEDRLKELRRLRESGLITQDVYVEQQRRLLEAGK